MLRRLIILGLILGGLMARPSAAQLFSFEADAPRAVQSLMAGYYLVDFTYDGDAEPAYTFNFGEPAFGAIYTRPRFMVTAAFGGQQAGGQDGDVVVADTVDLRLVDLSLSTWGELHVAPEATGRTRLFVPIVLHSNYRRVSPRGGEESVLDAFSVTTLGLGAGVGLDRSVGALVLEARAHPVIALATSSFGDALGSARLLDAHVQLHTGPVAGRFGLSLGYSFRGQVWNVNASDLFADLTEDLFDYRGRLHLLRAGVNW